MINVDDGGEDDMVNMDNGGEDAQGDEDDQHNEEARRYE